MPKRSLDIDALPKCVEEDMWLTFLFLWCARQRDFVTSQSKAASALRVSRNKLCRGLRRLEAEGLVAIAGSATSTRVTVLSAVSYGDSDVAVSQVRSQVGSQATLVVTEESAVSYGDSDVAVSQVRSQVGSQPRAATFVAHDPSRPAKLELLPGVSVGVLTLADPFNPPLPPELEESEAFRKSWAAFLTERWRKSPPVLFAEAEEILQRAEECGAPRASSHINSVLKNAPKTRSLTLKFPAKRSAIFVEPSPEQVAEYGKSIGFTIDGEEFVAHYKASGWMRNKTKIKDWKACVVTWKTSHLKREREKAQAKGISAVQQQSYEVVDLTKRPASGPQRRVKSG